MAGANMTERLIADRYLLGEQLGRGGMGVVWRAQDQLLGRAVAVKQVHLQPGLSDDERHSVQQRVMREARAAASLNHVGAVTVYDVVEDDDQAYIVMEIVEAPTLAELVAGGGALPLAEVARVGMAVCDVLTAAHERGIVHRDLKPANVLVTDDRVKLTDFGIATVKDDPRLTSTGIVLGSPSYISPEQARGNDVTTATDVWGLGATLCYAATGVPPFDRGEAIATLTAVANDELVLHDRAGLLTPLLAQMLDKDPAARPSLAQVRAALVDVVAGGAATASAAAMTSDMTSAMAPVTTVLPVASATATTSPTYARELPPAYADEPVRRSRLLPVAVASAAGLAVIALAVTTPWDDDERGTAPSGVLGSPSASVSSAASASPTPAASRSAAITIDLPVFGDLSQSYTDERAGYTVRYPDGWERVARSATATDFREPGTGRYLRIDWTDSPKGDPKKDWERQSQAFGARHDGYDEIRIESTEFRGEEAAIWEYAYNDGGERLRASNLAIVTDDRGFALNFQSHDDDWGPSQDLYDQMRDSFQLPSGD